MIKYADSYFNFSWQLRIWHDAILGVKPENLLARLWKRDSKQHRTEGLFLAIHNMLNDDFLYYLTRVCVRVGIYWID